MNSYGSEMTWSKERAESKLSAERALEKCKKRESELMGKGHRYVTVGNITQILVPCDKDGNPTKEGVLKIEQMQRLLGL